ncbi:MAG TPA: FHA domain-containing protein [Spirochaetota bacterium]|nr:FHA domain-containing protein [Spirochaetota bacterium]
MPDRICPRCKKIYSPYLDACPDCGMDLIPYTNPTSNVKQNETQPSIQARQPAQNSPVSNKETVVALGRLCSTISSFEIAISPGMIIGRNHGSLVSESDRFLTISRDHAEIRSSGSSISIVDLNSNNGTWVNGKRLEPGVPCPIKQEDSIRLADHEFIYKRFA